VLGDFLAREWQFPKFRRVGKAHVTDDVFEGTPVAIVKPRTYMNRSGTALGPLIQLDEFDLSTDMLVVVDDYALPIGTFRIRSKGSAGGHNGLRSIEAAIDSQDYARLRIGVGPLPDDGIDPADFVLSELTEAEVGEIAELLPTIRDSIECWIRDGISVAMTRFNRKVTPEDS